MVFDHTSSSLTRDYKGTSPKLFLSIAEQKLKPLVRGEFDTDADMESRLIARKSTMKPLSMEEQYAFRMDNSENRLRFLYNVALQSFNPESYGYMCGRDRSMNYTICDVGPVEIQEKSYIGSNAFGVKAEIDYRREKVFGVAIPTNNSLYSHIFRNGYFSEGVAVPAEKAKAIGSNNIGVVFVGTIAQAAIIDGERTVIEPTRESPNDFIISRRAVPFNLNKVLYFVKSTGEILKTVTIP